MTAVSTTLPLYWDLASSNKSERINASVKLVSALQQFQNSFVPEATTETESEKNSDDDEEEREDNATIESDYKLYVKKIQAENAPDVGYAIQRLVRGLGSPRESSRLGFAVALTELLSQLDTISCEQILALLRNASQITGSMSGQEERDMLFAKLFGLKAIIQSGLLFRQRPLRTSSTSSGTYKAFEIFVTELLNLAETKSWLRESCGWTLLSLVDAMESSDVGWKSDASSLLFDRIFVRDKSWSPEKVALTIRLQKTHPDADWQTFCGNYFKNPDILSTSNLNPLGRLLKDSLSEESEADKTKSGSPWKPQLHFSWDIILDNLLSTEQINPSTRNFQDFYRIVVDESLFASSSSPQRKYWGFLVFQKSLHRLPSNQLPMLFTKNFMRTWINQLSKKDRFLHKIARQVTNDVQAVVEKNPQTGFTLVLQLTGTNGSFHFDRITKTKTIENILTNMNGEGIKDYLNYLLKQVNENEKSDSFSSVDARRNWIIDQMTCLIRRNSIPRTDEIVKTILEWLTTNGFFTILKNSPKSTNVTLHTLPEPSFTRELQKTCRSKLLACVADLTTIPSGSDTENSKSSKATGIATDGETWLSKVLKTITELEKDTKHAKPVYDLDEDSKKSRDKAISFSRNVHGSASDNEVTHGIQLLTDTLILKCISDHSDGDDEADWETLDDCLEASTKLISPTEPGKKASKKEKKEVEEDFQEPINLLVDIIVGLLEHSSSFSRTMANQSFAMLTSLVTDSTVDLILTQLERRDPSDEILAEDMDEDEDENENEAENNGENPTSSEEEEEEIEIDEDDNMSDADEEEAEALRKSLQAAFSENDDDDEDASEASMDDEQMMAIDEKLAAVFRTRAEERKRGKDVDAQREATYFKNRVLDLVDIYLKKQSSNPLVLRFVLPLVELISTSSTDEKQLSDKTKGILRARLGKPKDPISISDPDYAANLLEALHQRARKSHSGELVTMISMCSTFVSKSLIALDEEAVIKTYSASISDFITRKASALNPTFIHEFIRRYPAQAWNFRNIILESVKQAVNGYRQCQAFHVLQSIFTSFPYVDSKKDEVISAMSLVSTTLINIISNLCSSEKSLMTPAQLKDTFKVGLQLCRFSRRVCSDNETLKRTWPPKKWNELASKLASSEHYKSVASLINTCQQIQKTVQSSAGDLSTKKSSSAATLSLNQDGSNRKRKQEEDLGNESSVANDNSTKKPKRKKVRKSPKKD